MPLVAVHAYGFAGTLRPKDGAGCIGESTHVRVTKTLAIASHGDGRFTVVHDFGAVVFFGFDEAARAACIETILARQALSEPHAPLLDDYLVDVRPGEPPSATFDRAIVPVLDEDTVEIVSLVLAQSVAMDYYEEDVTEMYARVAALSARLAAVGKLRERGRELARLIGSIMVTRNQVAMTLSLLDAPIVTWEREASDRLYRAMRTTFEIEDRYRTHTHKLGVIQDNLEILVDLVHTRRATALEATVIVLILFELVMGLLGFFGVGRH
ncbi:MAG: RMD1 family protein [Polyangiales bacterium]